MRRSKAFLSLLCVFLTICSTAFAQNSISIEESHSGFLGGLTRPYRQRTISPVNLNNSGRLEQLVRAGKLYLSAADVVALAIENNLDIEVQRYGPILANEVLNRAKSGNLLRSVTSPIVSGPSSVNPQGVNLTSISGGSATGSSVSSGGGIVTGIGPTPPTLDPSFNAALSWNHFTQVNSNTSQFQTAVLTGTAQTYNFGYQQGFLTGTNMALSFNNQRNSTNAPSNLLNPSTTSSLELTVYQNLLQGFGVAVNNRYIRVAKNNVKVSDLLFKQQLITTVSAVLNVYWDLVAFNENVRVAKRTLATSNKLYEDNKKQVDIGTLAPIEVTRAEAEVSTNEQNLLVAETNLLQQETILKNALSRNGVASPTISEVRIVPLDQMRVPEKESIDSVANLVDQALQRRPEIQQDKVNIESTKINMTGTRNALRPTLQAFVDFTNHGLSGSPNALNTGGEFGVPNPYFVGGYGNVLGQLARRNFPDYSAGFSLNIPFRNRSAQADYATDQLQLRQNELQLQKAVNQVRVDVQNAVIGVKQARAGYEASVKARILQEQTLRS